MSRFEIARDAVMRLPIVSLNAYFLWREMGGLRGYVLAHPTIDGDIAFLAGLVARVSLVTFLFLLVAFHLTRRRPVRQFESWGPKVDAFLGTALIYLILLCPRATANTAIDFSASLFLIGGTYLCLLAVTSLGRSLSIMPEARKLVTDGLYRVVRHPLYLAELIANVGVFLQYRSWLAAAILIAVTFFLLRRMAWEERILTEAFPEYATYRQRTRRLVPGVY